MIKINYNLENEFYLYIIGFKYGGILKVWITIY